MTYNINDIKHIEIFPDHCSEGIWVTLKDEVSHVNTPNEELPEELQLSPPLLSSLKALNNFYDHFAYYGQSGSTEVIGELLEILCAKLTLQLITLYTKNLADEYKHLVLVRPWLTKLSETTAT